MRSPNSHLNRNERTIYENLKETLKSSTYQSPFLTNSKVDLVNNDVEGVQIQDNLVNKESEAFGDESMYFEESTPRKFKDLA